MYTPAVPELPAQFNAAASVVNLTISGFYLFFPYRDVAVRPGLRPRWSQTGACRRACGIFGGKRGLRSDLEHRSAYPVPFDRGYGCGRGVCGFNCDNQGLLQT